MCALYRRYGLGLGVWLGFALGLALGSRLRFGLGDCVTYCNLRPTLGSGKFCDRGGHGNMGGDWKVVPHGLCDPFGLVPRLPVT